MRNRTIQRWLKKNAKEKMIPARDETGVLDLTPHEAVKNIVNEEKKELVRQYYEAVTEEQLAKSNNLNKE